MTDFFKTAWKLVLTGCRHKNMGWPIRLEVCSYRVEAARVKRQGS